MPVCAPLMEAEQHGSIRIQDLTKVIMTRRRFSLAKERLVPFEAAWNVASADDRPCAFHRISAVGLPSLICLSTLIPQPSTFPVQRPSGWFERLIRSDALCHQRSKYEIVLRAQNTTPTRGINIIDRLGKRPNVTATILSRVLPFAKSIALGQTNNSNSGCRSFGIMLIDIFVAHQNGMNIVSLRRSRSPLGKNNCPFSEQ